MKKQPDQPKLTKEEAQARIRKAAREGRVKMAPTIGIDKRRKIAADFMRLIFGWEPGEYLITDMSSLTDFGSKQTVAKLRAAVKRHYGIDSTEYADNLAKIFAQIGRRKAN